MVTTDLLFCFIIVIVSSIKIAYTHKTCRHGDIDTCRCDLVNGSGVIDISFGNQDETPLYKDLKGPDNTYAYNPCYAFSSDDGITGLAALGNDGYGNFGVGQQKGASWNTDESGSLFILYSSGDKYFNSTVNLFCDDQKTSNDVIAQGTDNTYTNYVFDFSGPALCPIVAPEDNKLSIGSISLISILAIFFVYLVSGIIYKKTRTGVTGTDLIPNTNFWSSMPGLIKDGAKFLVNRCKYRPEADYDNI
uniref:cation-dependent mannose-6-phosphate receptor-like n=1 Tax=Styela clava TaxID=7725 RepID=UPI001939A247|nr:cation-dependent mannose-6-phosphate receptor-like [Styela clava]